MSKYNLVDLLEGMSNDEWEAAKEADRLEAHPDRDKIKAIQAMIAKERDAKKGIKEMTGETYNRIDGLTNQVLKQQFLLKFSEIYEDMVEGGDPFDVSDVIQYLTSQMQEFAQDTRMDAGGIDESTGPSDKSEPEDDVDNVDTLASPDAKANDYSSAVKATSDQDNEEERDDAGVPPMYTEGMDELGKKLSQVMFKLQDDPKEYVKLYMDSVARDIKRGDKAQYDEMTVEDMIEDYQNYIADKSMAELKDHFGRFMKDF